MAVIEADGVIIKEVKVGEQDKIITVFTKQLGKISVSAGGVRSPKSRLKGAQLFCYSHLTLYASQRGYRLNDCELIHTFRELSDDLELLSYAAYFADIIALGEQDKVPNPPLLQLFLNTLYLLSTRKKTAVLLKSIYELRAACLMGFQPRLHACVRCGREEGAFGISNSAGGLVCRGCMADCIPISSAVLAAMRHISYAPPDKIFSFQASGETIQGLGKICESYLLYQLDIRPKTLTFLKELFT